MGRGSRNLATALVIAGLDGKEAADVTWRLTCATRVNGNAGTGVMRGLGLPREGGRWAEGSIFFVGVDARVLASCGEVLGGDEEHDATVVRLRDAVVTVRPFGESEGSNVICVSTTPRAIAAGSIEELARLSGDEWLAPREIERLMGQVGDPGGQDLLERRALDALRAFPGTGVRRADLIRAKAGEAAPGIVRLNPGGQRGRGPLARVLALACANAGEAIRVHRYGPVNRRLRSGYWEETWRVHVEAPSTDGSTMMGIAATREARARTLGWLSGPEGDPRLARLLGRRWASAGG